MQRNDGRSYDEIRPLRVTYDMYEFAAGSVLYEIGKTKVLCAVSLQTGVPPFLRGCKTGWLTAHYAMLPTSTPRRTEREIDTGKRNGRYVEISRLIGRSLRTILNLDAVADRTITIDCDVLQADGGTRTACVTAAYLALKKAEALWMAQGIIDRPLVKYDVAAVSVGAMAHGLVLDPSFVEDNAAEGDFNFVVTRTGAIIEVQGTAEKTPLAPEKLHELYTLAVRGVERIFQTLVAGNNQKPVRKEKEMFTLSRRLGDLAKPSETL